MLSQFQASYQRVEQNLQRLADSIAAYNPSSSAAQELVAADEEVNNNIESLVLHQRNHLRIQQLRQTADSLDETLRNTITTLSEARKDLLTITAKDAASDDRREVRVDELLAYANFISKTTVPPTFRKKDVRPPTVKGEGADAQLNNGVATPASGAQELAKTELGNTTAMDEKTKKATDLPQGLHFEPWPSQDIIQRGALANIQRMVESGQDPGSVLTAGEQATADEERRENEERERLAQEEAERRRMSLFDTPAMRRRPTMSDVFDPDNL